MTQFHIDHPLNESPRKRRLENRQPVMTTKSPDLLKKCLQQPLPNQTITSETNVIESGKRAEASTGPQHDDEELQNLLANHPINLGKNPNSAFVNNKNLIPMPV